MTQNNSCCTRATIEGFFHASLCHWGHGTLSGFRFFIFTVGVFGLFFPDDFRAVEIRSRLEKNCRISFELGRRLKRIAWGWTDKAVTNLSKMIMMRQYSREKWEEYWKEKLGIKTYFRIELCSIEISPCHNYWTLLNHFWASKWLRI